MKKAVLYARYSSDNQREESIAAQLRACREHCSRKGYIIVQEYFDEAKSGRSDNRPAYQKMLADAKKKSFDIIVFHKIDRNARNEYDYYFHKANLKKLGISQEYVAQDISDSPEGAMMETMLVGMAAYYSRNLAKEVMKGMRENAYNGKFNGGYAPLGYDIVDGHYVVNNGEAVAVKMIFSMYIDDKGYKTIAYELNKLGFKTRFGKDFAKNSIYSILSNPRYIGTLTFNKVKTREDGSRNSHSQNDDIIVVENAIPAIISKEDWQKVVEKMEFKKRRGGAYKAKNIYLLSGLLTCGECGSAMVAKTTSARGVKYQYYVCGGKETKAIHNCSSKSINLVALEEVVIEELEKVLFSGERTELLIKKISEKYGQRNNSNVELKNSLVRKKVFAEKRLDGLYSAIENSIADEFDLERLKKTKEEIISLRQKIDEVENIIKTTLTEEQTRELIYDFYESVKNKKGSESLRTLLTTFVNNITVSNTNITIQFKINFCDNVGAGEGT